MCILGCPQTSAINCNGIFSNHPGGIVVAAASPDTRAPREPLHARLISKIKSVRFFRKMFICSDCAGAFCQSVLECENFHQWDAALRLRLPPPDWPGGGAIELKTQSASFVGVKATQSVNNKYVKNDGTLFRVVLAGIRLGRSLGRSLVRPFA